jgi:hypothetical protein
MKNQPTMTSPTQQEEQVMNNELAAAVAALLRALGLNPIDESGEQPLRAVVETVRALLEIDKTRPELGLRTALLTLLEDCGEDKTVNPCRVLLALRERAGLHQPPASA